MENREKAKPPEQYVSFLRNYSGVTALFIFADIRGFGDWGKGYPDEIKELLEIEYSLAKRFFDGSRKKSHRKILVKFVGDGFFAANEVGNRSPRELTQAFEESANDILDFVAYFNRALSNTILHDKREIGVGFGMSFGTGYRFNLSGFGTDYVGVQVNLAARLCSAAGASELVLEEDLGEYAKETFKERLNNLQIEQEEITIKEVENFPIYRVRKIYEELKKPARYVGLNRMVTTIKQGQWATQSLKKLYTYARAIGMDTWHWCRNCSTYPTGKDIETSNTRPSSGEFCNECRSKEKAGTCR